MRGVEFRGFPETFRWNDGDDVGRYAAVEAGPEGLCFYVWSHLHGEGRIDEVTQSWEAFRSDGPARPVPPRVAEALAARARSER